MNTRRLGKTNLEVSEIAFGTWQLGSNESWGAMSETDALKLVAAAQDFGCNLFDTAPNYGNTESEKLLGKAFKGQRHDLVVVSKFGHPPYKDETNFSTDWFWQSLHDSLKRLQTDYLDVFLIHSPPAELLDGDQDIWRAMALAQQQGKIRYFGASVDFSHEVELLTKTNDVQVVEVLFNMLHQDVRRSFSLIEEHDLGVITKVPLDSGWLTGKYNAQSRFAGVRSRWSQTEISQRAEAIEQMRVYLPELEQDESLAVLSLAYLLSYQQVSSVIPGARSVAQLTTNFSASGRNLSAEQINNIESCWNSLTDNGRALLPW